ncbi:cytosolic Fe-S cluster assembly factor CFD1 [Cryptococcus bacillisporus CA1280]|uniref:Cytosolic Fe-S cluster assembly factor CFD1 n=1 Tax=Cryptococcus bacillisporus CA1280 TaxID=1296109 RepID=A0A0D0VT23_CRYGA|nr:cytosolic Fe-S cluster assembly factor CFD1 [Cryptococcus bacillisporus CA1280]
MADITETPVSRRLSSVKNIIIVLSGKGGVGKSSSSVQLALSLLAQSPTNRVGLIDLDITGPSLPRMVGLDTPTATVHQSSAGWVPVYVDQGRRLGVMSIGFLLKDRGDSVVWRGPKKDGMIRQFLSEVRWGDLDYLIIDTPPGTSDEHISLVTHLHPLFTPTMSNPTTPTSILISTPQTTALNDTLKSLSFTRKLSLPVMGLVENMAGYVCPCCGEISDTFGKGGGEAMAQREGVGFLGRVPIDTVLVSLLDAVSKGEVLGEGAVEHSSDEATEGQTNDSTEHFPLLDKYLETASSKVWKDITQKLVDKIEQRKLDIHANLESSLEKPTTA